MKRHSFILDVSVEDDSFASDLVAESIAEELEGFGYRHVTVDGDERRMVERAVGIISRDYQSDVEGIVTELKSEIESAITNGDPWSREKVIDWIDESLDGCGRVIYTRQAQLGLLASDNSDAYEEEIGGAADNDNQRMFYAMRADVFESLRHEGIDVNDDYPGFGERDCAECSGQILLPSGIETETYADGETLLFCDDDCHAAYNERLAAH